jgi:hypothetical protein
MATLSGSSAVACSGVVTKRSMQLAQGPSSIPLFKSIAHITTSLQAVRLPFASRVVCTHS